MLPALLALSAIAVSVAESNVAPSTGYFIDDSRGPARTFDGIGGLSGGGATSVLLRDYPEPARSTILDLLFKPNFGASLHIFKAEIGGDAQSTDGAESSHMHDPWTTNFETGYEWFILQQAKARNPNIKVYGLPWAFPQWVSCAPGTLTNCTNNPYDRPNQTAAYITSWVKGAKDVYSADVDYIGSWNERGYDMTYIETLRATLDAGGFGATKIIVADSSFSVANDINKNPAFKAAVWGLGSHYPNMQSGPAAEATGLPLWASEEDSTYNNAVGAGCWARVINQNYVRGNMTASINWNLLSAYMKGTNWWRAGLMTSFQPWSGAFGSLAMIWATAHTTQFSQPGWAYLANGTGAGTGSGLLAAGGSYVTLQNFATGDFSIVIEKMSRDHSPCCRPGLPAFFAGPEQATFTLVGAPAKAASLNLWRTHWSFGAPGDATSEFVNMGAVPVVGGRVTLTLDVDSLYTLTTLSTGAKGSFPAPAPPALFPAVHTDSFDACAVGAEAPYFSDQNGIFECVQSADPGRGVVMRQQTPLKPIAWGGDIRPHSLIGSRDLTDLSLSVDIKLTDVNGSALVCARLAGTTDSRGVVWAVDATGAWNVTAGMSSVQAAPAKAAGTLAGGFAAGVWHTVRLDVNGSALSVWVDGVQAAAGADVSWAGLSGHGGIGTVQYAHFTEFDNFALYSTQVRGSAAPPAAGAQLGAVSCASEVGPRPGTQVAFSPADASTCPYGSPCTGSVGAIALAANPGLCYAAAGADAAAHWNVTLAACAPGDASQQWQQVYIMLYQSAITHKASGRKLCTATPDIGAPLYAAKDTQGLFCGNFVLVGDEGEIVSINDGSVCLGAL